MSNKNIAFVSDENQAYFALTNALMIEKQTNSNLKIFLILFDIPPNVRIEIEKIIKKLALSLIECIFVESESFDLGFSKIEHITNITNARLYLSSILTDVDNVLYLDNDTVVVGDVVEVFDKLEKEYSYGRPWNQRNYWIKKLKKNKLFKNDIYVNAGVLYLNLKNIRKFRIEDQMSIFLKERNHILKYADQDVLNCNINFHPLPWKWNIARNKWAKSSKEISKNSSLQIFHFLSINKQWNEDVDKITSISEKGQLNIKELKQLKEPQIVWKKYYEEVNKWID